jgi:uncharacterized membrane protein YoaK (UPF0700 family)
MKLALGQTSVQWALAPLLAVIAGYLDGYGLLFLKTFVSFMSGNTTITGLSSGQGHFHAALPTAIAIVFFVSGSFLGNLLIQSRVRQPHRLVFGLIAGLFAATSGLGWHGMQNAAVEIAVLAVATGMMNPALSKVGAEAVSVTFVTGTLNRIGAHLAAAAGRRSLAGARGPEDSHLARFRIDASVWAGFLVGALLLGIAAAHLQTWALLPPCLVMVALSLFSECANPSADKR